MVCIYCSNETQVTNSRHQKRLNQVWRRRQCKECKAIFSTLEAVDTTKTLMIRTNKDLEPLSRENLLLSVYDSLRHRKSAVEDATALTGTILSQLLIQSDKGVLDRLQLVEIVSTVLERFDNVAATHYRAFHPVNQ